MPPETSQSVSEYSQDKASSFDIALYLEERASKDTFLMVEFGHDALPVAYHQSTPFTGNRAYIGFEAWMRDVNGKSKEHVQELHERNNGDLQNVHYQTLALSGIFRVIEKDDKSQKWLEGHYDPVTPLENETVDEVFIGNVFGDSQISQGQERTDALLSEAKRIVTRNGVIIIRETISPHRADFRLVQAIEEAGLRVQAFVTPRDENWDKLETQFISEPNYEDNEKWFYLFLSKQSSLMS